MNFSVISFDLQGTLSDSSFSDEFWLKTLPILYSRNKKIPLSKAKKLLNAEFLKFGKYDFRYYSTKYWLKKLKIEMDIKEIFKTQENQPHFFTDFLNILKKVQVKGSLILISSASKEFIDIELGKYKKYFNKVYSTLDHFNIPGKPPKLYKKIIEILNIEPSKMIHIGDSKEMDIENGDKAGIKTFYFNQETPKDLQIEKLDKIIFK